MPKSIEALFDEYLDLVLHGEAVDIEAFLAAHGDLSEPQREHVRALAFAFGRRESASSNAASSPSAHDAIVSLGAESAHAASDDSFGPYRLLRELGRGGQGVVYLALDTRLSRKVALKVLPRAGLPALGGASPAGPTARLQREAELTSKLDHPGICVIYEIGAVHGAPYIAMRYVEGETLARRISAASAAGGALFDAASTIPEVPALQRSDRRESSRASGRRELVACVRFIEKAAHALHLAHESGVIHRDIKPANLMVTPAGDPVILDFGLARDPDSDVTALTATGVQPGSPAYMSPEQIEANGAALDRRTDVYALGVVLYECLTLRRPFEGPTLDALYRAILSEEASDPRRRQRAIDGDLKIVIDTALEKDRNRRYKTAFDLAEDLRRWRERQPILARRTGPIVRLRRWTQRNPALATTVIGIFGFLIVALLASVRTQRHLLALSLTANSSAVLPKDPGLALVLAIESADRKPGRGASTALYAALAELHERRTVQASSDRINDLAVSADGRYAVTIGEAAEVRVWEVPALNLVAELEGHEPPVRGVDFSPDGRWLATTSNDRNVHVWRTSTWTRLLSTRVSATDIATGSPDGLMGVRFNPDNRRLLILTEACAYAYDVTSDDPPTEVARGHFSWTSWSPAGDRALLLGSNIGRLWTPATGQIRELDSGGNQGSFSPDGSLVVAPSKDHGVCVWNSESGLLSWAFPGAGDVFVAVFSPDGKHIFTGHTDGRGRLWNLEGTELIEVYSGHEFALVRAQFSPDGERILTLSRDPRVWAAHTGKEIAALRCSSFFSVCLEIGVDNQALSGHSDGSLRLWDEDPVWDRETIRVRGDLGPSPCASFNRRGDRIAVCAGSEVRVCDTSSGLELARLRGHTGAVRTADFTSDDQTVVTASGDCTVRLWAANTGVEIGRLGDDAHSQAVWDLDVSPSGRMCVTACADSSARVFEMDGGSLLHTLRHDGGVRCASFSRNGRRIVTSSEQDRTIRVWDAPTGVAIGSPMKAARFAERPLTTVFGPDGSYVVSSGYDGDVRIWDVASEHIIATLSGHQGEVEDVSVSPDGRHILSAGIDGTVRVWDAGTFEEVAMLHPHRGPVRCAAYSPDSSHILSVSSTDETVRVWPTDPLAAARDFVPRQLTKAERERYDLAR